MKCIKCGELIPEGRLKALPGTKTCTACSNAKMKGVVTIMKGEGDHTWIETIHLEHDEHQKYMEAENRLRKQGNIPSDKSEPSNGVPYGFKETKLNKKEE